MSAATRGISVKILGKEYQVTCPEGQEPALVDAAFFLDRKMSEIRSSGRIYGLERIAVMVALNLANELLTTKNAFNCSQNDIQQKIRHINDKIESVIATFPARDIEDTIEATIENSAEFELK